MTDPTTKTSSSTSPEDDSSPKTSAPSRVLQHVQTGTSGNASPDLVKWEDHSPTSAQKPTLKQDNKNLCKFKEDQSMN